MLLVMCVQEDICFGILFEDVKYGNYNIVIFCFCFLACFRIRHSTFFDIQESFDYLSAK